MQRNALAGLKHRNITLNTRNMKLAGHRTSLRLEPFMWDALEDISKREGVSINEICTQIHERINEYEEEVSLTSAIRVFIASYYRKSCHISSEGRVEGDRKDILVGTALDPNEWTEKSPL